MREEEKEKEEEVQRVGDSNRPRLEFRSQNKRGGWKCRIHLRGVESRDCGRCTTVEGLYIEVGVEKGTWGLLDLTKVGENSNRS